MTEQVFNTRPPWPHKVPEELARWLLSSPVTKIEHHWKMTGNDTSKDWLMFWNEKGESRKMPTRFDEVYPEVKFSPDHARLIQVKGYPDVWQTVQKIDEWEKANARDREEYERLRQKFEGLNTGASNP